MKKNACIYFDTREYALTKNDIWLRSRDGQWELKIPKHSDCGKEQREFEEIFGEEKIRQIFGVVQRGEFLSDIAEFGYENFCEIISEKEESFSFERKKVIEYLKTKKPDHYQVLVARGVVIENGD